MVEVKGKCCTGCSILFFRPYSLNFKTKRLSSSQRFIYEKVKPLPNGCRLLE